MIYRANFRFFRSPLGLILIIAALIWLFSRPLVYGFGERVVLTLARPFWSLGASGLETTSRFKQFFITKTKLINENERLQQNLTQLMAIEIERARLATDNAALRAILNYQSATSSVTRTAARILTRASQSPLDAITADVGQETVRQPFVVGDLVVGAGNVALGQVIAIANRTVKIELYSSWGSKFDVLVGLGRVPAQAKGRGSGNFAISLPRDLAVKINDPVFVIRGENEYVLGIVKIIERDPSDAFQEIFFRSPLNLELLSWVEIHGT